MAGPILVTGSHRSGTTWVGKLLARAPRAAYVHEPFNPQRAPGWIGARLPHWYLYICAENEGVYGPALERVVALRYPISQDLARLRTARQVGQSALEWPRAAWGRLRRAAPLLKDPIALFSSEWLASRFGARVVVMVRHPAAFAGSLKRLEWGFDFSNWADQPLLVRDLLAPFGKEISAFARSQPDIIDQAILMWNGIHHAIALFRERHPEWVFVKYEELAERPVDGFRRLAGRLEIPWDARMDAAVARYSSERNRGEVPRWMHRAVKRDSRAAARTWLSRLTEEERARVRAGTEEVARAFYTEADWAPV